MSNLFHPLSRIERTCPMFGVQHVVPDLIVAHEFLGSRLSRAIADTDGRQSLGSEAGGAGVGCRREGSLARSRSARWRGRYGRHDARLPG